jgi:hypothetical protein
MGLTRIRAQQITDIDYKQAVRVATDENITLAGGAPVVVDGVTLQANNRVLVRAQSNAAQNGIYFVSTLGSGSNGTWARTSDANQTGEIDPGMVVMVTEGVAYADTPWKLITNGEIIIGVTELTFEQFGIANTAVTSGSYGSGDQVATFTVNAQGQLTAAANTTITANAANLSGTTLNSSVVTSSLTSVGTLTSLSATGNVTGANLITAGNVYAPAIVNNGAYNTQIELGAASGIIAITSDGNSTQFGPSGAITLGGASQIQGGTFGGSGITLGASQTDIFQSRNGNVTVQVGTGGAITSTWTFANSGNLLAPGNISATGNITGGNINTAGDVRATAGVYGLELYSTQSSGDEGGQVNLGIPATNTSLTGQVTIDIFQNKLRFFQGNNAKGAYIDLTAAADGVGTNLLAGGGGTPGGANTYVQFNDGGAFGGNASFTYDKVLNTVNAGTFAGTLNGIGQNFKVGDDAWIGDINEVNTIGLKGQQDAANAYIVFGNSDATGKLGRAGTGPLTYTGAFSATGNITGGNLITTGLASLSSIAKTGTNGVGNIGSAESTFDTVFAKATSAQYADLAEIYSADQQYPAGTVVIFGGNSEITQSLTYADPAVAGVISTDPAYIMNSSAAGRPVALQGRVPCKVVGNIAKGDLITSSQIPGTATRLDPADWRPGSVIGKALEHYNSTDVGTIEVVVGRV